MAALKKAHLLPGLIGVLLAAFLVALEPSFRDLTGPAIEVGDEAPEFDLMSDQGESIRLQNFRGRFVVLNFWATWCPPCVEEIPSLNRFHQKFLNRGVAVLGISVDADAPTYLRFVRNAGVQFLTGRDPERRISHKYGTFKYPETYFLDRQGKVVQKIIGPANWDDPKMIAYMEELLWT